MAIQLTKFQFVTVAGAILVVLGAAGVLAGAGIFDGFAPGGPNPIQSEDSGAPDQTCSSPASFEEVADEAGLDYESTDHSSRGTADPDFNGAYATDYDGDGWTDVLLIGGERPVLFENTGGAFEPSGSIPEAAYAGRTINTAVFFDYDGSGREDLLLLPTTGSPVFLANTADGFEVRDVGLDEVSLEHPAAASTADYSGDGNVDVFIGQYGNWTAELPYGAGESSHPVDDDNGVSNLLLRNTGSGFEDATSEAGIHGDHWTLATSFVDFTGDGDPDIHVGNDFNNDLVYVNRGDGTFDRVIQSNDTDRNAMSSEVADFSGDGRPDIFVTNIYFRSGGHEKDRFLEAIRNTMGSRMKGNNLLVNRGNGTFVDEASEYGVRKGGWGWAATATDFDNDGHLDLFHANQNMRKVRIAQGLDSTPYLSTPMYWEGNGDSFAQRDAASLGFEANDGRGVVALDYDDDGYRDLLLTDLAGQYKLYENQNEGCHSLDLRVLDEAGEIALGAEVDVTNGGDRRRYFVTDGTDYQSQQPRVLHVGLGGDETADRIEVVWPDGTERTFENVSADERLVVTPSGIETVDH